MRFVLSLRKLVLGETWALPIAVAVLVGAAAALRAVAPELWGDDGALLLAIGVAVILRVVVARSR